MKARPDGRFVSIGSLEPQFCALLLEKACLDPEAILQESGFTAEDVAQLRTPAF